MSPIQEGSEVKAHYPHLARSIEWSASPFLLHHRAEEVDLKSIGYSWAKARSIIEIAREIVSGPLKDSDFELLTDAAALERLQRLRGVGRWTGEYILLRGLGRLDVFPADDAGGRNSLMRWLGLRHKLDYAAIHEIIASWRPYRGMLFFFLMLDRQLPD